MTKRALITGVMGQDGGHLSQLLNKKNYKVYGLIRGQMEGQNQKLLDFKQDFPFVELVSGDLADQGSLVRAVEKAQPDEVYNLAAISHVGYSFLIPDLTADITGRGVLRMLEAIRITGGEKTIRFYQASTSEMFGGMAYNRPTLVIPKMPRFTRAAHMAWPNCMVTGSPGITAKAIKCTSVAEFFLTTKVHAAAWSL